MLAIYRRLHLIGFQWRRGITENNGFLRLLDITSHTCPTIDESGDFIFVLDIGGGVIWRLRRGKASLI